MIIIIPAAVPATQELDTISTTTTMEHPTILRATSRISQQVTLTGPVIRDQLFKIQELLRHLS